MELWVGEIYVVDGVSIQSAVRSDVYLSPLIAGTPPTPF